MITFLKVTTEGNSKPLGILQMIYEVWPGGQVSKNWEWIGTNGTDDGGTWDWEKSLSGKVSIALDSNLVTGIVGRLLAERWNERTFPPPAPWFIAPDPYEWHNILEYYGRNRTQQLSALWLPN
jgi:hypothetical protein